LKRRYAMSKIESLTPEQEQMLNKHRNEYLQWGLSCEPMNQDAVKVTIGEMYSRIGKNVPSFWFCQSPAQMLIVISILKSKLLGANLWDNLGVNLGNNLWDSDFWGQMDMFWIAYYRYPEQYLHVDYGEFSKVLQLWDTLGKSCGWWYPYENICFVSDRPEQIHKKGVQLHNDSGPAVLYRDGYALWFLNGVDVGELIVTTPADQLDVNLILTTKNAEVRREIVRKIGIERVCDKLKARVIDTQGDYSLLLLDLQDGRKRPYLKMLNPSIGTYHIEGVPPDCDTVEKAITWRNQTSEKPVILT
jgi:hypothetical protein